MTVKQIFLILILTAGVHARGAEYVIDTRGMHASILFKFRHIGISWLTGEFKKFNGTFTWDEDNPADTTITVNIDPASLDSNHAERDRHVKSSDYLDVKTYPEARFVSTRVVPEGNNKATVYGNLTLHGITREIAIDASLVGKGDDPWGGYRAGFVATTTLHAPDFGYGRLVPARVELSMSLEGIRQ